VSPPRRRKHCRARADYDNQEDNDDVVVVVVVAAAARDGFASCRERVLVDVVFGRLCFYLCCFLYVNLSHKTVKLLVIKLHIANNSRAIIEHHYYCRFQVRPSQNNTLKYSQPRKAYYYCYS